MSQHTISSKDYFRYVRFFNRVITTHSHWISPHWLRRESIRLFQMVSFSAAKSSNVKEHPFLSCWGETTLAFFYLIIQTNTWFIQALNILIKFLLQLLCVPSKHKSQWTSCINKPNVTYLFIPYLVLNINWECSEYLEMIGIIYLDGGSIYIERLQTNHKLKCSRKHPVTLITMTS